MILRNLRNRAIIIEHKGHQGIMKTKSFIRSKILGFLTKKLTKSLENVSAYGKTYRTARTTKNEPPFEQTLGTI